MKLSCLIAVFLLLNLGPLISQNGGEDSKHTFYIQKWRKNGKIKCKNVVLLIKKSTNLTQYNNTLAFALKTKDELILRGIKTQVEEEVIKDLHETLFIELIPLEAKKTILNLFATELPMCSRIEVKQINLFVEPYRRNITSRIAIAENEFEISSSAAASGFAERVANSIKLIH